MSSESLVFPLLSLQQPSPLASIPAVAKSTLSSAPSSMRTNSDSHSPLDSGSQSTLVDIAPATKEVIVSVGSPVPPSVPGPGALAGASPTVHVTTSVLPSVFHRSSVNHSCNQEADDGILTDTSVQSCGHPNRLQLPSLPFNPSAPCDTLPAGSRQVASSASTTPLATQLLSTKAGSMQGSINATNPSVCPVDSQTDGEGMNIESSGLNLTPFIPAPPTETALGVSMQRTTGVDSCGVSRSSDVFMEEEGPAGAAQGGDESRNVHGNHGAGMSTSEPRGVSESRHNDQSEASVDIGALSARRNFTFY
ncbi:hypothetical protein EDC04DRAFT_491724 [Pisolithus marmoratus]|nr:hypothetical protein EDC04DRAFT_491724 [Pisolithus marmoratus]